jgi:ribosomal protein L24
MKPGDLVDITGGKYAGQAGIVVRLDRNAGRVYLRILGVAGGPKSARIADVSVLTDTRGPVNVRDEDKVRG